MTESRRVTLDDVLDLESSGQDDRVIAETLVRWSDAAGSDDDWDYTPAELLVIAAEHLDLAGLDGADELLDRAEKSDGQDVIDLFEARVAHQFRRGNPDAAFRLEEEARRCEVKGYRTYGIMVDLLNSYGAYERAIRWANIGLRRMEDLPDADQHYDDLLVLRYRMRRARQATIDGYDRDAEEVLAHLQDPTD